MIIHFQLSDDVPNELTALPLQSHIISHYKHLVVLLYLRNSVAMTGNPYHVAMAAVPLTSHCSRYIYLSAYVSLQWVVFQHPTQSTYI